MNTTTKLRRLFIGQLLAAAVLLLLGLVPAQAFGADVIAVARLDSHNARPIVVLYSGEIADDGTIQGTYMLGPDILGSFEGWVDEDGTLVLEFTTVEKRNEPNVRLLLSFIRVLIDLDTGYAEAYGGEVTGTAHVHIRN